MEQSTNFDSVLNPDNNIVYKVLEIKGDKHRIKKEIQQRYL